VAEGKPLAWAKNTGWVMAAGLCEKVARIVRQPWPHSNDKTANEWRHYGQT
jgi:hypothetical protein